MGSDPFERWLNETVVLDTGTPILYIGKLLEVSDSVFILQDADMHDCRDGHAHREKYIAEAHAEGTQVNRRTVMVMRSAVISVSRLSDVVSE